MLYLHRLKIDIYFISIANSLMLNTLCYIFPILDEINPPNATAENAGLEPAAPAYSPTVTTADDSDVVGKPEPDVKPSALDERKKSVTFTRRNNDNADRVSIR